MSLFQYVTKTDKKAAELYSVKEDYKRFPQKMHMILQTHWNPDYQPLEKNWIPNRRKFINAGKEGFSIKDYAYQVGAASVMSVTNFPMHDPDQGGNSWQKLTIGPFGEAKWEESPETMSLSVKSIARSYGADDVGICELDRRWVYSHWYDTKTNMEYPVKFSDEPGYEGISLPTKLEDGTRVIPKEMKYVIVLIHEMDREEMRTGPTLPEVAATRLAYSEIAFSAISLAEFIRALGYNAIPSSNCTAINIPLAVDAGLGEMGRNAKLIHPRFGPRVRISKVITDLPLLSDKAITFGVKDFCLACKKCAQQCPVKALPEGGPSYEPKGNFSNKGVLQWQCEHDKCRSYWTATGTNCGLCITTCPFNKGEEWIHHIPKWVSAKFPVLNPVLVKMDDLFGYGRAVSNSDFWKHKGVEKR